MFGKEHPRLNRQFHKGALQFFFSVYNLVFLIGEKRSRPRCVDFFENPAPLEVAHSNKLHPIILGFRNSHIPKTLSPIDLLRINFKWRL